MAAPAEKQAPAGLAPDSARDAALERVTAFLRAAEKAAAHKGPPLASDVMLHQFGLDLRRSDLLLALGLEPGARCSCCQHLLDDPIHARALRECVGCVTAAGSTLA